MGCDQVHPPATTSCPVCGLQLSDTVLPYQLAGKFRLERRAGAGGMGVVFRALDMTLHRAVAIKTVPTESPTASVRLRQEAQAVARFSHPNLATIYGVETWRGTFALVLEFLEGGTLAERLRAGPLSCTDAIEIAMAIAAALDHIHVRGVLHRDVKPTNIGFTAGGIPQLMDFGLAWSVTTSRAYRDMRRIDFTHAVDANASTRSGSDDTLRAHVAWPATPGLAGTPLYYSPESIRTARPSAASDLWALAMVLYESIAGVHPLADQHGAKLLESISHARIPSIATLVPNCPRPVVEFLGAALALDGTQRASASHFRDRLRLVKERLAVAA
jgi:serine/threonine protein kinase